MHRTFARLVAVVLACAALTNAVRADTVYVISRSTGGLFRFDSADPNGTMTTVAPLGTFSTPEAMALGPDGHLYIGESGVSFGSNRIVRYVIATGSVSEVTTLGTIPGAIAFKPGPAGAMLIGRNPFPQAVGQVLQVTGWNGGSPVVSNFTSGTNLDATSSPGLAVAQDGAVYVSSSVYTGLGGSLTGTVLKFGAAGNYLGTVASTGTPGDYGPAGLVLNGSTLFSASVQDGKIYTTDLSGPTTSVFGAAPFGFEVGPLAQLSDGNLLAGSVSGFTDSVYRFGNGGTLLTSITNSGFGQISGIVAVPEPSSLVLAGLGCALAVGVRRWQRRLQR
ncbi:MAG: PEP-CTERM sorting domain-containing protein [Pirellulales bacterium]